jgi:GNAT superfamily N-acetyltransferase
MPTSESTTQTTITLYRPGERPELFWQDCGPVFSDRLAVRELGGPFTDDPHTGWAVARSPSGELQGLASVRVEGERALLDHAYVRPAWRRQGVHRALLHARLTLLGEARRVRVHANDHSFPALVRLGFVGSGQRGRYLLMEADALLLRARLTSLNTPVYN